MSAPEPSALDLAQAAKLAEDGGWMGVYGYHDRPIHPTLAPLREAELRPLALALAAARAEGFRAGIEAAAKVCHAKADYYERHGLRQDAQSSAWSLAGEIRALTPEPK